MDKYLVELIDRMNYTGDQIMEAGFDSSKTISWKALREVEKITNPVFIPQLMTFIENEKDKDKRDKAYFILGHISKNINDKTTGQFLINRIKKETDKYVIGSMLSVLAKVVKPEGTDFLPLIHATKDERWLVSQKAIQAFANSEDEIAETTLINFLETSEDPYELIYSNATLNKIGTPKAIPHLQKHLKSRKRDVKLSAQFAIDEIKKRHNIAS
jgi:HEAT repeat protein